MYAKSLHIRDFKCFGKTELELQYPGRTGDGVSETPNVNLILGDNGGGKSSVLRALGIAVLAPVLHESGFVPYRLVRRPRPGQEPVGHALLKIEAIPERSERLPKAPSSRNPELQARIERRSQGSLDRLNSKWSSGSSIRRLFEDDRSPAFFIVGYGATRRVETSEYSESSARKLRGLRYQRIAGLFEDHVALRPLQAWLPRLQGADRRRAVAQINRVLPRNVRFSGRLDKVEDQYLFKFEGVPTPFSALSDGYKAFIGWVGDLVGHLCDVASPGTALADVPGIVLLDEVDLHLHPEWQRNVVPALASGFPKLQFVFTSHSPLVASTVRRENVFVTDVAEDGTATLKQLEERVYGRSAEQLLLSSYFGLQTTRPESFQDKAQELFEKAAEGDSNAALRYLERLTDPTMPPKAATGQRRR
ncbi:AAA family ATPase [Mycobacterium sp. KBS0706]|uniref:AAA family ATPase n=1 Tax=Mycobacterium sp. KBS0706 TaxID=2578109 RepID=UPI00163D8E49|nr:AAA family ATPase [Mycobacterium sp. KBS0706]